MASADLVLLIVDGHVGWTDADAELLERIPEHVPHLVVANKADLPGVAFPVPVDVHLSALDGRGEEQLVQAVLQRCGASEAAGVLLALNERQRDLAAGAAAALARSQEAAAEHLPWDFWTIDLREGFGLGEITGEELTDAVLDRVFSRFCIEVIHKNVDLLFLLNQFEAILLALGCSFDPLSGLLFHAKSAEDIHPLAETNFASRSDELDLFNLFLVLSPG